MEKSSVGVGKTVETTVGAAVGTSSSEPPPLFPDRVTATATVAPATAMKASKANRQIFLVLE